MKNNCMKPLIRFRLNIPISIIRMILLTVTNITGVVKIVVEVMVICVIKNTVYHKPKSLVL